MRIINTAKGPRYMQGVNKSLKPGEATRELPLETVFSKSFWKQVDNGLITFKLNDDDKAMIARILGVDAKPLPEIKPNEIVHPATARKQAIALAEARAKVKAKIGLLQAVPKVNPACVQGTPSFGGEEPIPVVMPGQAVSLEQLKRHNQGVAKKQLGLGGSRV